MKLDEILVAAGVPEEISQGLGNRWHRAEHAARGLEHGDGALQIVQLFGSQLGDAQTQRGLGSRGVRRVAARHRAGQPRLEQLHHVRGPSASLVGVDQELGGLGVPGVFEQNYVSISQAEERVRDCEGVLQK